MEIHSWSKYFTPQWIPSPSQLHLAPCSKKQGTPGQPTPKLPCMSKSQAIQALALKRCSWLVKQIQLDNFQSKWDTWPAVPGLQWLWSWSLGESQLPASLVLGGTLLFQQLHRWVLWEPPEAKVRAQTRGMEIYFIELQLCNRDMKQALMMMFCIFMSGWLFTASGLTILHSQVES